MSDPRKENIINTSNQYFSAQLSEGKLGGTSLSALNKFLDDASCTCLVLTKADSKGLIECTNRVGLKKLIS